MPFTRKNWLKVVFCLRYKLTCYTNLTPKHSNAVVTLFREKIPFCATLNVPSDESYELESVHKMLQAFLKKLKLEFLRKLNASRYICIIQS